MHTQGLLRNCTIISALALGGCPSDEEGVTGTASNSGTESDTDDDSDSDEDSDEDSDSQTMGSNSNSDTTPTTETTDDPTTVDTTEDPTDPSETESESESESESETDPSSSSSESASASASESETDSSSSTSESASDSDSDSNSGSSSTSDSASESDSNSESDSDTNGNPDCEAPGELIACDSLADMPTQFQAIGLGCAGDANQVIPINNAVFNSVAGAWRVATQFGTFIDAVTNEPLWGPREGDQFLIISTGAISAPNNQGVVTMGAGAHQIGINNGNPDGQALPAPMSPNQGSNNGGGGTPFINCDGVGDCSDTIEAQWVAGGGDANDLLWMQFDTAVPGGTNGFAFDFSYFSAEFPEWVDTTFNDIFLAWSSSETYTGNLCFINDQPCTVTALWPVAYQENAPELAGTGFDGVGGSTGWFTATGSAAPGETLQLTFAIFDMGDSVWDTAVILDNWRWDCEGCVPSEVMGCGIEPTP